MDRNIKIEIKIDKKERSNIYGLKYIDRNKVDR